MLAPDGGVHVTEAPQLSVTVGALLATAPPALHSSVWSAGHTIAGGGGIDDRNGRRARGGQAFDVDAGQRHWRGAERVWRARTLRATGQVAVRVVRTQVDRGAAMTRVVRGHDHIVAPGIRRAAR